MANRFVTVWFDIASRDVAASQRFYEAVLNLNMTYEEYPDFKMALFPMPDDAPSGCIFESSDFTTSDGILLYFNANGRLNDAVAKAELHGGTVLQPIHAIGPHGFRAILQDLDGHRIALHSETES